MSAARIALFASFVTLGILTQHEVLSVRISNITHHQVYDNAPDNSVSESILRERYRRLIPYMTYYLVNNNVAQPQTYPKTQTESPMLMMTMAHRRPPAVQYVTLRPILDKSRYQAQKVQQDERFVPSVQYDPKEVNGQDVDYFVPVRYTSKGAAAYNDDYPSLQSSGAPAPPVAITIPVSRYHPTTSRPMAFQPQKLKPAPTPLVPLRQDYSYPTAEFESVRFVTPKPRQPARFGHPRPTVLEPVATPTPPPAPISAAPRVSLNHVLKSLHLTNQLPEVLNKDNLDSSIRTLQEILYILNSGKKDQYVPANYYDKLRPIYTKPKVITESNYEATQIQTSPHNELVELSPENPYVTQIKPPPVPVSHQHLLHQHQQQHDEEQEVEIKPAANPYINHQIKTPAEEEEVVEIKPVNPYINKIKTPLIPVAQEDVVEIKPANPYINQIKTTQTPAPPTTDGTHPTTEEKKIVEYYIPIIQDIDEQKVVYEPSKEVTKPIITPTTELPTLDYSVPVSNDDILEDEKYTIPETTVQPEHKITHHPQVPNIPPVLKYGATRGKPHVDYPAYSEIPETNFNCKQQRYKGFFGDPDTGCQVWHYCDLNGGKSSFLCPNGTIFSQVALTCDWWFNVKCESTTQLYVLNERLYKYILPIMPKFPEDFSGPEVDKYLELKFKEMEAKMKEKKKKKEQEEKDKNFINTLQSIEDSK